MDDPHFEQLFILIVLLLPNTTMELFDTGLVSFFIGKLKKLKIEFLSADNMLSILDHKSNKMKTKLKRFDK